MTFAPLDLVRLARPRHWVKNVFVLIPVPFAVLAGNGRLDLAVFSLGFFGFCLINSAVYAFNDWFDADADRLHPKKKSRPIASGRISGVVALMFSALLAACGTAMCAATGIRSVVTIAIVYVGINLIYCVRAKHIALLDVFLLSSGFVIRVLLGCALVGALPSNWLLLCTSSLALFLGLAKRRADLTSGMDENHRPSLKGYNQVFLDQAISIAACASLVFYSLYTIESEVLVVGREVASVPLVAFAILNYMRLVFTENAGGAPEELVFSSWPMQVCAVLWSVVLTWSLGIW